VGEGSGLAVAVGKGVSVTASALAIVVDASVSVTASAPGEGEAGLDKLVHADCANISKTTPILNCRMLISLEELTQARILAITEIENQSERLKGFVRPGVSPTWLIHNPLSMNIE
jgi:hypothetical protein